MGTNPACDDAIREMIHANDALRSVSSFDLFAFAKDVRDATIKRAAAVVNACRYDGETDLRSVRARVESWTADPEMPDTKIE